LSETESRPDEGLYRRPALTVDGVVLHRADAALRILLIERGRGPFRGSHALPGGFVDYGENPDDAIGREIAEETGLSGLSFTQFRTYGAPGRDPRGHTVSVVYLAEVRGALPPVTAGDDAAAAAWHPVDRLPALAFDHGEIVAEVLAALPTDS
jgi:8-oxo-dGTP diphosphatase